jgi:hypothetical protein
MSTRWKRRVANLLSTTELTSRDLAKLLGTEERTVIRWLAGTHEPSGAVMAALRGMELAMAANPSLPAFSLAVRKLAAVGGLELAMFQMLNGSMDINPTTLDSYISQRSESIVNGELI